VCKRAVVSMCLACLECGSLQLEKIAMGARVVVRNPMGGKDRAMVAEVFECWDCGQLLAFGQIAGAYRVVPVKEIKDWKESGLWPGEE
jgi:hypothetical protein